MGGGVSLSQARRDFPARPREAGRGRSFPSRFQRGSGPSLAAQQAKNPPAMREAWIRSLGGEDPLEEGMGTHSSVLAWRIPWTEEPGGLHSPRGCKQLGTTERPGTQHTRSSKCLARIKHFRCSKPLKLCYCAMAALGNQWNHHIEIVLTTLPCEHITGVVLFPPDQQP